MRNSICSSLFFAVTVFCAVFTFSEPVMGQSMAARAGRAIDDVAAPSWLIARCSVPARALSRPILPRGIPSGDSSSSISDLQVTYDLSKTQANLYNQILQLTNDPSLVGSCDNAALKVAGKALFYWDVQVHLRAALKESADAIRDGAKLAGANSVAKVAELGGEVISAYDMDQPEAALGKAIVNNSMDWATDQAKSKANTGNKEVDEALKDKAKDAGEKAKEKLINALFGGSLAKGVTESTVIAEMRYCSPKITFDFQAPAAGNRGGLYLLVEGTCDCHNKNNQAQLRYFYVSVFLPLEGMDARLEWSRAFGKSALDIKDLIKSSQAFAKGVKDSLNGTEGEKEPDLQKLTEDVAKKAGKASNLTPTLVLIPRFGKPILENMNIRSECGCTATGGNPVETPPPATPAGPTPRPKKGEAERICEKQCGTLYGLWQSDKTDREEVCFQYLQTVSAKQPDKALEQQCRTARDREESARQDYYRCLERCYKQAVGAKLIGSVPEEVTKNAHPAPLPQPTGGTPTTTAGTGPAKASGGKTGVVEKAKPKPYIAVGALSGNLGYGGLDGCLVGTWRTESVVRGAKSGGAGILMTIDGNGGVNIDYTGMQELKEVVGRTVFTDTWTGSAGGHISATSGALTVSTVDKSAITAKFTTSYGARTGPSSGLGPVFEGGGKTYRLVYTCTDASLVIKTTIDNQTLDTFTFQRVKKAP